MFFFPPLGDFWKHLLSKSEYRYQESVFLEALQCFICRAKFRKYYSKWSHHTLKLFVLMLHKPRKHPWRSYWKFPFVFQGSNKGTKVWCLTGGIAQVRIKKIRPLSHTLWLLIPVPILMGISNNTTAPKWLTITVNYKTIAAHPNCCFWRHWEGRVLCNWDVKQWEWVSKWPGYVYSEERKIQRKHDSPLQIFRVGMMKKR